MAYNRFTIEPNLTTSSLDLKTAMIHVFKHMNVTVYTVYYESTDYWLLLIIYKMMMIMFCDYQTVYVSSVFFIWSSIKHID